RGSGPCDRGVRRPDRRRHGRRGPGPVASGAMLDFSPEKMFFIFLIVMVVLGPEKLPEISRKIGKAMGELRKLSGGFREEMSKAVNEATNDSTPSGGPSATPSTGSGGTEIAPSSAPTASDSSGS